MKRNMLNRVLSLVLVLSMVMSFAVMPVGATEGEGGEPHVHTWVSGTCSDTACNATCNHEGTEKTENVTASTCAAAGTKTVTCVCGVVISTETLALAEHSYNEATGLCTGCGAQKPTEPQGEEQPAQCSKNAECTATENHDAQCPKHPDYVAPVACDKSADCKATENHDAQCPKHPDYVAPVTCDGSEDCQAVNHETTCAKYDPCAVLGCTDEEHKEGCPYTIPCDTPGCEKHKGHLGECGTASLFVPRGEFKGGFVNMTDPAATYLSVESANVYAEESVVIKVFDANNTHLATTTLVDESLFKNQQPTLTTKICITATSGSWNTVWEEGKLRSSYVPAYGILYVDGIEKNRADIRMVTANGEAAVNWADVPGVPTAPSGTLTKAYTSENTYWGECGGNAKESFEFKFYNGTTYMGYTSLNNVGGIIDGDVYVSWNMKLDAASNTDEYWTMAWEIQPTLNMQPNRVEQWVDGEKVAECAIEPNWSDSTFPVVAVISGTNGIILKYVNNYDGNTLVDAAASAPSGATITLLRDIALGESDVVVIPDGVTLNGNGKTITSGSVKAGGNITLAGATTVNTFGLGSNNTVTIGEGASLKVTGARMTISYGNVFNVIGNISRSADKNAVTPSLEVVNGLSFNGDGGNVQFNITNAYVKLGDSTSKNSGATGVFNVTADNSIVDFTKTLKTAESNVAGLAPTFNFTFNNSVVTTASHMELWHANTNMTLNGSTVTVGGSFANAGTLNVQNGSHMIVAAPIMSSHGGNTGTILINNATFELKDSNEDWQNAGTIRLSGYAPKLITNDFKNVGSGKVVIDASALKVSEDVVVVDGNGVYKFEGTTELVNGENVTAKYENGDVTLHKANYVAQVGDDKYEKLEDALLAVTETNNTVTILQDITISGTWDCRNTGAKFSVPVVINGNGKTIKFTGEISDGSNHLAAFRFENSATVSGLTIDMSEAIGVFQNRFSAISAKSDLTVSGCNFIGSTTYTRSRAIIFGETAGAAIGDVDVSVTGSSFTNWGYGIVDNMNGQDAKTVTATGNTFNNAGVEISAAETLTFTGNTVSGAGVSITSYSNPTNLQVTAQNNTLDTSKNNAIKRAALFDAQNEFTVNVAAMIGDEIYGTLQAAVDAVQNGETIVVNMDITAAETVTVPTGKAFALNLNNKTVAANIQASSATLTIENGSIVNTNSNYSAVEVNAGSLALNNVNITSARHAVRIDGPVTATINGGTYKTTGTAGLTTHAMNVSGAAKVTIQNGSFIGPKGTASDSGSAVNVQAGAEVTINGGSFSGGLNDTLAAGGKLITIGGTYDQDPTKYCNPRFAGRKIGDTYSIIPAIASVTDGNDTSYYGTAAQALAAVENGESFTILNAKDAKYDISVVKSEGMTITDDGKGNVTIKVSEPVTGKKYGVVVAGGATYRVDTTVGTVTIDANGIVDGDNVPVDKNNKPVYRLIPFKSLGTYVQSSTGTLTFESNMIFDTFSKAFVDGSEIKLNTDYVASRGSTIIELSNAYLRKLAVGKHTLTLLDVYGNSVPCDFHVSPNYYADASNPKTGDDIFAPAALMLFSVSALAVLMLNKKRIF